MAEKAPDRMVIPEKFYAHIKALLKVAPWGMVR